VTDEEKEAFLLQQYQRFEQYVFWFLGELIFKDTNHNCLDDHKDYVVLNDIVKPKYMSVISYLSRVNYMYEIIPYLQAPSDEGENARKADYNDSLHSEVDARVIRLTEPSTTDFPRCSRTNWKIAGSNG
jgi:hypothetical protein